MGPATEDTIATLQRRRGEIESNIRTQTEVLRNLQRSKSDIGRQLNDLQDPFTRLPLEISSAIFTQCAPALYVHAGPKSHRRRTILDVEIPSKGSTQFIDCVGRWLARSGSRPIISLYIGGAVPHVLSVVAAYANCIRRFQLPSTASRALFAGGMTLPALELLQVKYDGKDMKTADLRNVLQCAPNLAYRSVNQAKLVVGSPHPQYLTHSALTGRRKKIPHIGLLPRAIFAPSDHLDYEHCFRLLPTLLSLRLEGVSKLSDILISALTNVSLPFLPDLRKLILRREQVHLFPSEWYSGIAQLLQRRIKQIQAFSLEWTTYNNRTILPIPREADRAIFRELTEGGLAIALGRAVMSQMREWNPIR
ncbi:hypothetical protein R3P38DRAFT_3235123 [Favolaschia claudopus]|uniref:Uncharacterized protein n=1 Tax=Favolaschia claudopus TaxID=2862362 RepID=A0AAV9ZFD2_9AGAR